VTPTGERRTQWWVFAELSRRLDLPLFGSPVEPPRWPTACSTTR
jgi:hypothetical protein